MPCKRKAAFFDMGETLYSYEGLPLSWKDHFQKAWKQALTESGHVPTDNQLRILKDYMTQFNTREVPREIEYDAEHIFSGALRAVSIEQRHLPAIIDNFFDYFRQRLTPYEETVSALKKLKTRHIYIGALTDVAYGMPNHFIADDLKQVGILNLMDCWKTSVDVGFRKPHPKGYTELCANAECLPEEAIYVGNERKDVDGANRAGLTSVLIHRADTGIPEWGQDHTIHSILECENLFQ